MAYSTFIAYFNILISDTVIKYNCSKEEALNKYIMPTFLQELRDRNVPVMGTADLEILNKSIETIKATKKEKNLLRNVSKTIEELMHGKS
tara:strand:- start:618 stop:887 length:270 start_codon:yes stop_codon:yes gene_type:complete